MEVFSLLKFWRNAGGTDSSAGDTFSDADFSTTSNDVCNQVDEESDDEDSFFDLVFTSTDCDTKAKNSTTTVEISDDFHLKKSSKCDGDVKSNFMESATDVFYKSKSFPNESNSKPQSPISLLKSSPKLRVFMLGFSKPKLVKSQVSCASMAASIPSQHNSSKRFTVNCKIEEVPIASLLTRDNSLRAKLKTERLDDNGTINEPSKRFSKDVVNKYLNLIKPMYVKASKRCADKMKFPEQSPAVTPSSSPATVPVFSPRKVGEEKQTSRTTVFRDVRKHLGKTRSEARSSAGKVIPSPAGRRDDSVLQQQDGIQSAILHCKRSYNSSAHGCSVLSRSESAPAYGKSINQPRISVEEEKRCSI